MAKTYLSGNAKEVVFEDGNSIMNVYVDLDDAKEKGALVKTKAGKNGLAFTIARKPEVGQYGDTHYLYLKPITGGSATVKQPTAMAKEVKTIGATAPKASEPEASSGGDELPF